MSEDSSAPPTSPTPLVLRAAGVVGSSDSWKAESLGPGSLLPAALLPWCGQSLRIDSVQWQTGQGRWVLRECLRGSWPDPAAGLSVLFPSAVHPGHTTLGTLETLLESSSGCGEAKALK